MPRFAITFCDPSDNSIETHINHAGFAELAICRHRWIVEIYKDEWVAKIIMTEGEENVLANIWNHLGWLATCVNLDSEIMKDLNGGDGSASCPTEQELE